VVMLNSEGAGRLVWRMGVNEAVRSALTVVSGAA